MSSISTSRKRKGNRLGKCDVCRTAEARYTCPRCETVTCSLDCVKTHKKELDCDGVRVRTKYVPVNQMNEHNLLSDYRLLEDVRRCADNAEWQRISLELPLEIVADTVEQPCDKSLVKNKPVTVNEKSGSKEGPSSNKKQDDQPKKKHGKRRKGNNPEEKKSKSSLLIAKADRIRKEILNRQGIPQNGDVPESVEQEEDKFNVADKGDKPISSAASDTSEASSSSVWSSTTDAVAEVGTNELRKGDLSKLEIVSQQPNQAASSNNTKSSLSHKEIMKVKRARLAQAVSLGGAKKATTMATLSNAAFARGIYLCSLPERFEKHWENTSFFLTNEDCIYWHIKLSFLNANFYSLTLKECAETTSLENLVKRCLRRSKKHWNQFSKSDPLEVYRMVDFKKISVLMAADKIPGNQRKFYVLDLAKSLKENFVGKCIVEFPQLCIAIEDCYVVSNVQENLVSNFFGESENEDGNDEHFSKHDSTSGLDSKKKRSRKKVKNSEDNDADRESGELTDSSGNESGASDSSEDSDEELFQESEFRSIYKDLLCTFESDTKNPPRQ